MQNPKLIENTFRNYLDSSLKNSHEFKVSLHQYTLNIVIFITIVVFISGWLYYCYKTKTTQEDKIKRNIDDHNEIVKKVRMHHYNLQKNQFDRITNLPVLPNKL
jgi:hypothetical protein